MKIFENVFGKKKRWVGFWDATTKMRNYLIFFWYGPHVYSTGGNSTWVG